jgi:hypothetical protein
MLKANFKRSTIASRAILAPPRSAVVSDSRRRVIISTRESARPDGFRSTIETRKEPAVVADAVARKRIRDAMKMISGEDDFWSTVNRRAGEEASAKSTNLKEKDSIFPAADSITNESGTRAFDEKESVSNTTKGLQRGLEVAIFERFGYRKEGR